MLPFQARVDLRAMAMKGCSAFPKVPALLGPHHQIIKCHIQNSHGGGVLSLCWDAVSVFYSPSWLGKAKLWIQTNFTLLKSWHYVASFPSWKGWVNTILVMNFIDFHLPEIGKSIYIYIKLMLVQQEKSKYFKMNRSTNDFKINI